MFRRPSLSEPNKSVAKLLQQKREMFGYAGLHVGCGSNVFDDFVNTDIEGGDAYLDAISTFPIPDETVDFVYSEHFIEHIKFSQAEVFLDESLRVLSKGGVNRIVFPDLRKLIDVALTKPELAEKFRNRSVHGVKNEIGGYLVNPKATPRQGRVWDNLDDMINNFTHYWGHKYIWSAEHLRIALLDIGYSNVVVVPFGTQKLGSHVKEPANRWGQDWTSVIEAQK
jgi:hypothetical protein